MAILNMRGKLLVTPGEFAERLIILARSAKVPDGRYYYVGYLDGDDDDVFWLDSDEAYKTLDDAIDRADLCQTMYDHEGRRRLYCVKTRDNCQIIYKAVA